MTMIEARLTAIVRLTYSATGEMSLDREREYDTSVEINGKVLPCKRFKSPIGDERWRETVRIIRTSTENRDRDRGPQAGLVAGVGYDLFQTLAGLAPELADFLAAKTRRRLVIMSVRPEIHALPWEALSDRRLESVAGGDLSIVRCTEVFKEPCVSPPLVHIYSKFGPDTNDDVLRSAQAVRVSNVSGRPIGVAITDNANAEIVNLVAHGSEKDEHRAQTLVDEDRSLSPEQLASRYRERLMVLMWSCFSAMVHSWGASPALALHAAENVFVLGFVAPLNLKASAEIAQRFYDSVFGAAGSQDPERAITEIRAWQFKEEYEFCDWASMTVWLRQPLDLSALPLGTVRVPETVWSATASAAPQRLRDVLGRDAALGDARLLQGVEVTAPFPDDLIKDWRGPVVVLDGRAALENDSPFQALQIDTDRIPSRHSADRFLSLFARLETYRYSLLLWTNVSSPEVMLIETLDQIPPNIAIVLTSPYRIRARWPGSVATDGDAVGREEPAPAGFIDHVLHENFSGALACAADGVALKTDEDFSCLYLAAIKQGRLDLAKQAIERVSRINPLEADLLQANFDSRKGRHRQARERYRSVLESAHAAHALREEARAEQELAYVANEMGDRGLADQTFRNAITTLERIDPKHGDSRWHAALARALRDYADLLADQGSLEALPLLRRATAIHAFERRPTQVAYCFLSRSKLMLRLGRFESAAADAEQAAIVFSQAGNADGWVAAITLAAQASSARNHHDQARAVLDLAASHPSVQQKPDLIGKLKLEAAAAALVAGNLGRAHKLAKDAFNRLPVGLQRERAAARKLQQFVETLL